MCSSLNGGSIGTIHPVWGAGTCGARVTLTTSDSDNLITTGLVTITATFDRNMQATPTISIAGVVTNTAMSLNTSSTVWEYRWEVPSSITTGSFSVTVGGTDTTNIVYSGTESITLQIDPDFYLDSNGVTIKCPGVANGATGYVDGKLFTSIALFDPPQLEVSNSRVGVPVIDPTASGPYSN